MTRKYVRVLSVSDNESLRCTRDLLLRSDGYEIVSISSDDLLTAWEIKSFDVAVVCHTVTSQRAMPMLDRLRRYNPALRILRLNAGQVLVDPLSDAESGVLIGPGSILKAVREMLDRHYKEITPDRRCAQDSYCRPFPKVLLSERDVS